MLSIMAYCLENSNEQTKKNDPFLSMSRTLSRVVETTLCPANVNTFLNTVCLTVVGVEGAKEEEEDDLGHESEKRNRGFFFPTLLELISHSSISLQVVTTAIYYRCQPFEFDAHTPV